MAPKKTVTRSFDILVADTGTGRTGFRSQQIIREGGRTTNARLTGDPAPSTGTITVSSATFGISEVAATGSFTVLTALSLPISLTINGNPLTGLSGTRTPGSDDFDITGTTDAVATEITAAINDGANSFSGDVTALAVGSEVRLTAAVSGFTGNSVTISSSDESQITASGSTLIGGGQTGGETLSLTLGEYTLIPGVNWEVTEGDANATATSLASAISNLPGYSATPTGADVDIVGPTNGTLTLDANPAASSNFTLSPSDGELVSSPSEGPPEIF